MIEKTISRISDFEKKSKESLERLEKNWKLKLKAEEMNNIEDLKKHRAKIKARMETEEERRISLIKKEISQLQRKTDSRIRKLEKKAASKEDQILDMIQKSLR